jgi:predicted amidohydrolase
MLPMTTAYRALALQSRCHSVTRPMGRAETRSRIKANIETLYEQVTASRGFIGPDLRLVVLPEYALTGHPVGEEPASWRDRACLEIDAEEYAALGRVASDAGVHLAVNAYEIDPNFPALYFQACVIFDASGAVVARYRRLNSLLTPSPLDVWDRYLEIYGIDGVFPVARTAIGALAPIASEEILFPEIARAFAVRGAEVFVHSSSEASSPEMTPKQIARRARAIENVAYVVSANSGGIDDSPVPGDSTNGGSAVVDFEGRVLAAAGPGESMVAHAEIDLEALWRARRKPGMSNLLVRNRFEAYASTYAQTVHPANGLADADGAPARAWFLEQQRATIARLIDEGLI